MSVSADKKPKSRPATKLNSSYSRQWYTGLGNSAAPEWLGYPVVKHPNDLLAYQQILFETKPDIIIETGTFAGGSALFLASICDLIGHGNVISIDLHQRVKFPEHPRIDYLIGLSSTDPVLLDHVRTLVDDARCMVVLDSAHNSRHVYNELRAYSPYVAKGCYLIVEDTNRDGYYLGAGDITDGEGPAEALKRWQPTNRGFVVDRRFEEWGFTQNPNGYLRRLEAA